jgi:putative hemolysin
MLIGLFARIPAVGEHVDWRQLRFEILDLDGARIDKVLVTPIAASEDITASG